MIDFLNSFQILTKEELATFASLVTERHLNKGELLVQEGEVCNELVFIKNGILRSFYVTPEGEEMTYCIAFKETFMTAMSSLITGRPTEENIEALVATDLLVIQKQDLDNLYNSGLNYLKLGKFFSEMQYIEMENRIFSLQRESALQRYESLLRNQPAYVQYIPLNHLASYLGVTPRHLSRLRKELTL